MDKIGNHKGLNVHSIRIKDVLLFVLCLYLFVFVLLFISLLLVLHNYNSPYFVQVFFIFSVHYL